jgi:catechol 2,3-dioxygenase-like lactoylglutathione lyase family enzyme
VEDSPVTPKIGTIALGNIGLNVSDLDISEAFYQEVFGLRVAEESLQLPFRFASMARGGKTVMTLWERSGGYMERCLQGLHHLSFEADSLEEVNRTKGILDNLGVRWFEAAVPHHEGPKAAAIYFADPDGTRIRLYQAHRMDPALEADARAGLAAGTPELATFCGVAEPGEPAP